MILKQYLTREQYNYKVSNLNNKYWNSSKDIRWRYMKPVIDELSIMKPNTALEIGTAQISLLNFSDSMDIDETMIDPDNINNKKHIFDCSITPWDIPDKFYDVFVACQVLEHLGPNQSKIFSEIKRISKSAIITLPYKWQCEDINDCHHNINDEIINQWTNNEVPYKKELFAGGRIMLCYKF